MNERGISMNTSAVRRTDAPDAVMPVVPSSGGQLRTPSARLFQTLLNRPEGPHDVFAFLSDQRGLNQTELLEIIQLDQERRWPTGTGLRVEGYLSRLPAEWNAADDSLCWMLICNEFLIRRQNEVHDGQELISEFVERFPHLQDRLRHYFETIDPDSTKSVDRTPADVPRNDLSLADTCARKSVGVPQDLDATTLDVDDADGSSLTLITSAAAPQNPDSVLARCAPFAKLPPLLVHRIEERMNAVRFEPGQPLMKQGEAGTGLYVLTSGRVRVEATDASGESHFIAESSPGDVLGEMALLTDEPRTATVTATEPTEAQFLPGAVFDELAREYPVISRLLTQLLAERLGHSGRDALAGKTLSHYRIAHRLGRGGMAIVYRAEDQRSNQNVALKMMSHRLVYDADALRLFQREASLIESFDHPHIVRMFERFKAFRSYFIVMEFCDGVSLDRVSKLHGPLPEPIVRGVLGQLASALRYAHARNVVHRDVKPSNVMLTRDGAIKLMDFGLANPVDETTAGHIAGTPRYMAPEQLRGEAVDTRADMFALGMTAWRLLTGNDLITERTLRGIQERHLNWRVPAVPGISAELQEFIQTCLQLDRAQRNPDWSSAEEWSLSPNSAEEVARLMMEPASASKSDC